jgi:hypothetical protein
MTGALAAEAATSTATPARMHFIYCFSFGFNCCNRIEFPSESSAIGYIVNATFLNTGHLQSWPPD